MMMNPLYHEFSMLQTKLIPRSQIDVKQEIASGTIYILGQSALCLWLTLEGIKCTKLKSSLEVTVLIYILWLQDNLEKYSKEY